MRQVMLATPYDPWNLGSLGNAAYALIKQFQFPLNYDEHKDKYTQADHDRLLMWNYDHFRRVCEEHLGTGELGIPNWVQDENRTDKEVLAFVCDAMLPHDAIEHNALVNYVGWGKKIGHEVKWTGYRIMGTVNRSNGYPVYTLELFANHTGVPVYSDECAPNVKGSDEEILDYNGHALRRRGRYK